ncbi:Sestrin-3 [Toxocara canis]|uniref:Sestrin-3 n=1 Tax=Toxocara canis TaxID=6265 RepID=A0A0B2VH81_TOXCA|nr:Sestrin-3 [Toxocara canis]
MSSNGDDAHFEVFLPDIWQPLEHLLSSHPKYRRVFNQAIDQLFYGRGPMAAHERHYVALMAASRHRCHYLMNLHRREFTRLGGNREWLKGLSHVPLKISSMDALNGVLAHQPWAITTDHLTALTKCRSPANWSLSELVQATIVLAQTHVLCSFILGSGGIEPNTTADESLAAGRFQSEKENGQEGEVELLLKRMHELQGIKACEHELQLSELQRQRHFLEVHTTDSISETDNSGTAMGVVACRTAGNANDETASLYARDLRFSYIDFALCARNGTARTHKIHDLSWEDQGYSCVDELYNEMADILDKKFTLTQNLTYFTMGGYSDVDTSKYRTAIWMYIHSLYGIRHDDYNYGEVNMMLSREMKTFIKTICCFPDKTTASLRQSVMVDFQPSEKVHVLLMVMESRLQAELIYLFRTLLRLFTSPSPC